MFPPSGPFLNGGDHSDTNGLIAHSPVEINGLQLSSKADQEAHVGAPIVIPEGTPSLGESDSSHGNGGTEYQTECNIIETESLKSNEETEADLENAQPEHQQSIQNEFQANSKDVVNVEEQEPNSDRLNTDCPTAKEDNEINHFEEQSGTAYLPDTVEVEFHSENISEKESYSGQAVEDHSSTVDSEIEPSNFEEIEKHSSDDNSAEKHSAEFVFIGVEESLIVHSDESPTKHKQKSILKHQSSVEYRIAQDVDRQVEQSAEEQIDSETITNTQPADHLLTSMGSFSPSELRYQPEDTLDPVVAAATEECVHQHLEKTDLFNDDHRLEEAQSYPKVDSAIIASSDLILTGHSIQADEEAHQTSKQVSELHSEVADQDNPMTYDDDAGSSYHDDGSPDGEDIDDLVAANTLQADIGYEIEQEKPSFREIRDDLDKKK